MKEGTRVRATKQIVENDQRPDPDAEPCSPGWVHAVAGDEGEVVHVEPLRNLSSHPEEEPEDALAVTVGFDRTGTATLVFANEIEPL